LEVPAYAGAYILQNSKTAANVASPHGASVNCFAAQCDPTCYTCNLDEDSIA